MPVKSCYATVCPAYEDFMTDEHRWAILWGSAGSGKSVAIAQKIILRCITETGTPDRPFKHNFAVFRKYGTTVLNSVFAQIKEELERMGIDHLVTINTSYHSFRFWNGAMIRCMGLDDPEKLKSLVATSAWVEEATEFNEGDIDQLNLRFRGISQYYKQICLSFNPVDEEHWIKRKFFDTPQHGFTLTVHTTYKDNFFLDEQYIRVLEEQFTFDPNLYMVYVEGKWGHIKTGSEFYFNFKRDRHVRDVQLLEGHHLHVSFDFNVNPYISAIVGQIIRKDVPTGLSDDRGNQTTRPFYIVNILDEFALTNPNNTTEILCDSLKEKYAEELRKGLYIYGDASGNAKSTKSNISDYDIITHILGKYFNNYSMRVPNANPMIRRRRWFIAKLMYGGFNIELNINPRCKKLISDLEHCVEAADGSIHKQTARNGPTGVVYEKYGHHSDALCYLLCEAFINQYDSFM